ncbi:YihY family inner membrane protein [Kiloniella sp. b19]|uniref:YihY family inner membrane protein n=1 Tax=Kiloniella sp. GXU_MW_B19 TaxID=3141326 RepID=UPI0031E20424
MPKQASVTKISDLGLFARHVLKRFGEDNGPRVAASLSYSSLLAMVPLMTIALALLSAFPGFEGQREQLVDQLLSSLLPSAELQIAEQLNSFVQNARQTTAIGILVLGFTALMLLNTIKSSFDMIWRIRDKRPFFQLMLVYWALLTMGPLLMGTSLSLSSYSYAMTRWVGEVDYTRTVISFLLPILFGSVGFTILYAVVPNRAVQWRHALIGAVVATVIFELLKKAFGLYITNFPSYQAIYGALATVPIFLVWLYLSWCVVILGAEIAASLPEWKAARRRKHHRSAVGDHLALSLAMLSHLEKARQRGQSLHERQVLAVMPAPLDVVSDVLYTLRSEGCIEKTHNGRWLLCKDLSAMTMLELCQGLGFALEPDENWSETLQELMGAFNSEFAPAFERSVLEVIQPLLGEPAK